MSKNQEDKITKSIQFDSEYNKNVVEPFLKANRLSFSFYGRELIIKDLVERTKINEK